jgi:hypothetical protein
MKTFRYKGHTVVIKTVGYDYFTHKRWIALFIDKRDVLHADATDQSYLERKAKQLIDANFAG